jgi:hypothetical protein
VGENFRAGVPKTKLAEQYNISVSSVERILRLQRVAGWIMSLGGAIALRCSR